MKIKFIDGEEACRNAKVIKLDTGLVCGYRIYEPIKRRNVIGVVKQKSIKFTLLILFHELAHLLVNKLFKDNRSKHIWIDTHMIRKVDKCKMFIRR